MNHSAECTCEESLCETLRAFSAQHPESVLYQTSLMSALLSGVYEGSTTIADLLKHGDFGLGTFNELDGELIAFSRSSCSSPRRAPQPWAAVTDPSRCRCPNRNGCCSVARSITSSVAATDRPPASSRPTRAGLRCTSCGWPIRTSAIR